MNLTKNRTVVSLVFVLTFTGLAEAQTSLRVKTVQANPNTGQVIGDIADAVLCLISTDGSIRRQTTENDGATVFNNVLPGNQTVRASASGFNERTVTTSLEPDITNFQQIALVAGSNPPTPCNIRGPQDIRVSFSHMTPPNPVTAGSITKYGFGLKNPSQVPLSNVRGIVRFPAGFRSPSVATGSGISCMATGGTSDTSPITVLCTVASLHAGGARSAEIKVKSPHRITGNSQSFTIRGEADPDNAFIEDPSNNIVDVTTIVGRADLNAALFFLPAQSQVNVGEEFSILFKVKNEGGANAPASTASLTIPEGAEYIDTTYNTFSTCSTTGNPINLISCNSAIPVGEEKMLRVLIRPTYRPLLTFVGTADVDNQVTDGTRNNNVEELQMRVFISGVDFTLAVGGDSCGDSVEFNVRIDNQGNLTSPPTQLKVTFPEALEPRCSSGSEFEQCSCVATGRCQIEVDGGITCAIDSISSGSFTNVGIGLRKTNSSQGSHPVTFVVDPTDDIPEITEGNSMTVTVTID